ncbi:MAG: YidC/Oxa1 family membrane protein insertase [Candidatus Buchananbacteria bacterium]
MIQLFNTILVQPLLNLLVFIYNTVPGNDLGIAIIILTLLIKLVLYPLSLQAIRSQKAMQELQPKMEEIKRLYKNEKEKQAKAMMDLYKENKVNPFSSCLPLLIQIPFLLAVYQVFRVGLQSKSFELLYPFVQNPGTMNLISVGFLDLSKPNLILAAITALAQFWQTKMLMTKMPPKEVRKTEGSKDEDMMAMMNKQMLYFMPAMTFFIGFSLPSGLILYWLVMTLLTVLQQYFMFGKKKKEPEITVIK